MKRIQTFSMIFLLCACENSYQPKWDNPDARPPESGLYCYPTLGGKVDCYKKPLTRCVRPTTGYEGAAPPENIIE